MRRLAIALFAVAPLIAFCDTGAVGVPEPTDKAWSYYYTRNTLWVVGLLWGLAVPGLILFSGLSARLRDMARGRGGGNALTLLIYFAAYSAIVFALTLPLAWYGGFVVEHEFGLSNQGIAKWAADVGIAFAVQAAMTYLILLGLYALLRKSPARWWLYGGLAAVPVIVLIFLVSPVWFDPLFNKFGPMKDAALEAKIVALAERAGIEGARIFEVDKSVDTRKVNAYVTGFADTKRIVLWDTMIRRLTEPQLLFVMGHEMGHYVLHHVWTVIAGLSAIVMLSLYAAHRLAHGLVRRYRARFGFERLDDFASYPLVSIVAGLVAFVATPAFYAVTRHNERQADRFGLEIMRDNRACAEAFVRLNEDNLGIARPHPVLQALRGSHPTVAERIEFCNTYRPWEKGEPLTFERYFKR